MKESELTKQLNTMVTAINHLVENQKLLCESLSGITTQLDKLDQRLIPLENELAYLEEMRQSQ